MMRIVKHGARLGRRGFLGASAAALPAAAALSGASLLAPAKLWAEEAKALKPGSVVTLIQMARDLYPHDRIPTMFYARAVLTLDAAAAQDSTQRDLLEEGVLRLDADARDRFGAPYIAVPGESDRVTLLEAMAASGFFKKMRGDLIVSFYNQHDLWRYFGYEGASAEYGGYLHRGFDDIDWLPKA